MQNVKTKPPKYGQFRLLFKKKTFIQDYRIRSGKDDKAYIRNCDSNINKMNYLELFIFLIPQFYRTLSSHTDGIWVEIKEGFTSLLLLLIVVVSFICPVPLVLFQTIFKKIKADRNVRRENN